jgi:hypothetical protein
MEHLSNSLEKLKVSPEVSELNWEQLLLLLVPGWTEKGTRLPKLEWPKNQIIDQKEIKKVPGWTKKGTQLIHKKSGIIFPYSQ